MGCENRRKGEERKVKGRARGREEKGVQGRRKGELKTAVTRLLGMEGP